MSKTMKRMMILALLTVVSVGLKAQEVNVAYNSSYEGGTVVTKSIVGQNLTITVTPDKGYFIEKTDIEVIAVKDPASASRGDETISIDGSTLELTLVDEDGTAIVDKDGKPVSDPEDLTVARYYSFVVPEGLGAWVSQADFHEANKPVTSGKLNDKVSWEVTGDAGSKTLTLSGEGAASLDSKGGSEMPWSELSDDITELVIDEGIEAIGDGVLAGFKALTTITLKGTKYVGLGKNELTKSITVDVYGQLYNKYKASDDWGMATIASTGSVAMDGVAFGSGNDYDVFVSSESVLVPSELLAFTVSAIDGSNVKISEIEDGIIPAGVPVLLLSKSIDDNDFRTVTTKEEGKAGKSLLEAAGDGGKEVALGEVYLLYNDVFYLSQAGTIPAGGVYLPKPATKTRSALTIGTEGTDGTTAIDPARLNAQSSNFKVQSSMWYDLSGRRLTAAPTAKGLYIFNGKVVVIK